jgi:hypothetical protein
MRATGSKALKHETSIRKGICGPLRRISGVGGGGWRDAVGSGIGWVEEVRRRGVVGGGQGKAREFTRPRPPRGPRRDHVRPAQSLGGGVAVRQKRGRRGTGTHSQGDNAAGTEKPYGKRDEQGGGHGRGTLWTRGGGGGCVGGGQASSSSIRLQCSLFSWMRWTVHSSCGTNSAPASNSGITM